MKRYPIRSLARPACWAVLLFGGLLPTSCHKPEDDLGLDVLDPADALGTYVVDTTRIIAWNPVPEPRTTAGLSNNVLGTYLDPDFGLVTTGLVAQVLLSSNNVGQPAPPDVDVLVCDSFILSLAYDASKFGYGQTDPQSFRVFRVNEDLSTDSAYKSDHIPGVFLDDKLAPGRHEFPIQPFTTLYVDGDSVSPQLRLPLNTELGQEFLALWGRFPLENNENFLSWFKGLMVLPAEEASVPYQKAALYFNLLSLDSKLRLYYRDTTPGLEDTLSYDFIINTNSVRYTVSRFDHDRALQPGLPLALNDSSLGQQEVYLQALGGATCELSFPHLMDYAGPGIRSVAKAELVLPVDGSHYPTYVPPVQLFLLPKDADGNGIALPDQTLVGGIYSAGSHEYRFVITRWVRGVLNGDYPNTGLTVIPGSYGVSVNRAIVFGPEHGVSPMKLRLTFTTY